MEDKKIDYIDILYNSIIAICFCASFFAQISGIKALRYIAYSGFFMGIGFCLIYGFNRWRIIPAYIKGFLLLIFYGLLCSITPYTNLNRTNYIIFWLSATLPFLPGAIFRTKITAINIAFLLSQLAIIKQVHLDFSLMAFLKSTTSSAEINTPAFIFPIFFVYHLYKKNRWMAALNLVASIIFFKRIVFIALLVIGTIYYFQKWKPARFFKQFNPICFIIANGIYLMLALSFASGSFNNLLYHAFGVNITVLTMGRDQLYQILAKKFIHSDMLSFLFGHGTAAAYSIMETSYSDDLHNDVLKIAYDNGMILFCVFFYYLYKDADNYPKLSLAIMMNIFFLTDNTLIYTIVLMAFFLIFQEFESK